ncbi:CvpA family protein [Desulfovibrio sp. OttesenSCG-928-C06]|nr:CvpA family protein [Desulfovibrio sp. OttesenSCG-928-C06]
MELPVIGFVSTPDIIFSVFLLAMFIYGIVRSLGRELRWLLSAALAAVVTLNPQVHSQVTDWLSFFSIGLSRAIAYIAVYYIALLIFQVILGLIRPLRELRTKGVPCALLGGVATLLRAFMDCTMFIILASGMRLPWDALFRQSRIADFIVDLWHNMGLLAELYAAFSMNKFSVF